MEDGPFDRPKYPLAEWLDDFGAALALSRDYPGQGLIPQQAFEELFRSRSPRPMIWQDRLARVLAALRWIDLNHRGLDEWNLTQPDGPRRVVLGPALATALHVHFGCPVSWDDGVSVKDVVSAMP